MKRLCLPGSLTACSLGYQVGEGKRMQFKTVPRPSISRLEDVGCTYIHLKVFLTRSLLNLFMKGAQEKKISLTFKWKLEAKNSSIKLRRGKKKPKNWSSPRNAKTARQCYRLSSANEETLEVWFVTVCHLKMRTVPSEFPLIIKSRGKVIQRLWTICSTEPDAKCGSWDPPPGL